ncbi:MAG TPA: hypothetical protein VHE81_20485 [Lacipirellulaceae bacterium]|nr:hypothetical protein [Lacipirellulaceae bacterium]
MHVELELGEIESLIEGLDCLKTKIAFTKGLSPTEKNERIIKAETLEAKLRQALESLKE